MLKLTRCPGESVRIGEDVQVFIVGVWGDQVRIGVTAPRDVAVDRAEIRERKNAGIPPPKYDSD